MTAKILPFPVPPRRQRGHMYIPAWFGWALGLGLCALGVGLVAAGAWLFVMGLRFIGTFG